jgi:dienelactone hydrolase
MKYHSKLTIALPAILLVFAAAQTAAAEFAYESVDSFVESRGVQVPMTWTYPKGDAEQKFPLVVMAHGHGGSRKESGSFDRVANDLAARGVATIRMDFPGCGDSTESFANNNLSNMLADILASRDYAVSQPQIDADRVGLFGWSMGGRLVLMLSDRNDEFNAVATWAPAVTAGAGSMVEFLGGPDAYAASKAIANSDGYAPFTTRWGQEQRLGPGFFTDMEESKPLEQLRQFTGSLFVLYGDQDDVVLPEVAESAVTAAANSVEVSRYIVRGADHGLGVFSDEPHYTDQAVSKTVDFLADRL